MVEAAGADHQQSWPVAMVLGRILRTKGSAANHRESNLPAANNSSPKDRMMDRFSSGWAPPPPAGADAESRQAVLVRRLLQCAGTLERRLSETYAREHLNPARVAVLEIVVGRGDAGCTQAEVAQLLRLSESNVCTLVERMQLDGWLLRVRSVEDRRKCILLSSAQGQAAVARIQRIRSQACDAWLQILRPGELESASQLLDRLLEVVDAIPAIAPPRAERSAGSPARQPARATQSPAVAGEGDPLRRAS
jgi:DNA-binding MarR family transcriptional regulator